MRLFKQITVLTLVGLFIFLTGCAKQINLQAPTQNINQPIQPDEATQPIAAEVDFAKELAQYGEKTVATTPNQVVSYQGSNLGMGVIFNNEANKPTDKWYFTPEGKNKPTYLLLIDNQCLIDAVGFINGSCLEYLSIDKNKNVLYDGYNGPAIAIHGEILSNKSIQVSNITLVQ